MSKATAAAKAEAIAYLSENLKPGDTVYTILRHVSKSGMLRVIGVYYVKNGKPQDISFTASQAIGYTLDRDRWGVKVSGCGMDMGHEVVYNLGRVLWPQGVPCAGAERCRSNDHSSGMREYGEGITHNDGGYSLRQEWL